MFLGSLMRTGPVASVQSAHQISGSCSTLKKKDNVRQFVVRREAGKKKKAPKIQRLVTRPMLQRKRTFRSQTRKRMVEGKKLSADYQTRLSEYRQEQKELRAAEVAKKKKEKKEKQ